MKKCFHWNRQAIAEAVKLRTQQWLEMVQKIDQDTAKQLSSYLVGDEDEAWMGNPAVFTGNTMSITSRSK